MNTISFKHSCSRERLTVSAAIAASAAMIGLIWLSSWAPANSAEIDSQPTTRPAADAVLRIALNVEDADRSVAFYTQILSFSKTDDREISGAAFEHLQGVFGARARIVRLQLGEEEIELTQYLTASGREIPRDSRSNDRWFQHIAIISSDMDKAYDLLRQHKVRYASSGPQTLPAWNYNAAGIRAFYFRDPDNHVLEILQFPPGKGRAQWHATNRLFLGIDHTAIVVADTDSSVAFYRGLLGMHVAGESENFGPEQEHLNNVFGAHLRITTLRSNAGPGVELLEYLAPRDGRPYPPDAHGNDLFNWETVVESPDVGDLCQRAVSQHRTIVSPIVTGDAASDRSRDRAIVIRDPDGHAVQVIQSRPAQALELGRKPQ